MANSVECLKKVIEDWGDEWKERLSDFFKSEDGEWEENDKKSFMDFVDSYKEDFIDNKLSVIDEVEKLLDNDLLYSDLKKYVDSSLSMYYATEALRVLEVRNTEQAKSVVDFVFEHVIIRFDSNFDEHYDEFGIDKKENFLEIASVLDFLSTFAVTKSLYKTTIVELIYDNIRLSKKMCQYIGTKIDKNFEKIQRKLIVEKLYKE